MHRATRVILEEIAFLFTEHKEANHSLVNYRLHIPVQAPVLSPHIYMQDTASLLAPLSTSNPQSQNYFAVFEETNRDAFAEQKFFETTSV